MITPKLEDCVIVPFDTGISTAVLDDVAAVLEEQIGMVYRRVIVSPRGLQYHGEFMDIQGKRGINMRAYNAQDPRSWYMLLEEAYHRQNVVAVTDHYLLETLGLYWWELCGMVVKDYGKVIISSARFKDDDPAKIARRIAVVGLHELGHLHGLNHHEEIRKGFYCPMIDAAGIEQKHKEGGPLAIYDFRDTQYCDGCRQKLFTTSSLSKESCFNS